VRDFFLFSPTVETSLIQDLVEFQEKDVELHRVALSRHFGCQRHRSFSLFPSQRMGPPRASDRYVYYKR
jgi:hypothetical protein